MQKQSSSRLSVSITMTDDRSATYKPSTSWCVTHCTPRRPRNHLACCACTLRTLACTDVAQTSDPLRALDRHTWRGGDPELGQRLSCIKCTHFPAGECCSRILASQPIPQADETRLRCSVGPPQAHPCSTVLPQSQSQHSRTCAA
jgi:hypothetical protein